MLSTGAKFINLRKQKDLTMKTTLMRAENDIPYPDPWWANVDQDLTQDYLRRELEKRRGNRQSNRPRLSSRFVIEQAAERYFQLLELANGRLKRRFDTGDFSYLLNLNCSPVWRHYAQDDLAGDLLDDLGLEIQSLDDISDPVLRDLVSKLRELTSVETYAIVDACEQVWRGYDNPLL
jgi:hypothetical protein